jgi:rod shape-determining protein MreC
MTARFSDYVNGTKKFLFYLISPTPEASTYVINASQRFSGNIKELVKAHQENIVLHKRLEQYAKFEDEYLSSREENIRLRNLFNFTPMLKKKTIAARVISREPNSWFQWVVIDKGTNNGIYIDAPVLVWAKNSFCVLGRIGEIYKNYAKVILITNALSALPAMIGSTGKDGLLEGQNNLYIKLNYLMKEDDIKIGESIYTSQLSSVFPPNILIGRVREIAPSDDERFRSVYIKTDADFNNLREVVVLISE